jgi:hypothetical protein
VEAELAEQVIVHHANKLAPIGGSGETRRDLGCDPVQNRQRRRWIQIRHFDGSDFESRHVQPAVRLLLNSSTQRLHLSLRPSSIRAIPNGDTAGGHLHRQDFSARTCDGTRYALLRAALHEKKHAASTARSANFSA